MKDLREILVGKNDNEQRADRFLLKYFSKAPRSFVFKMLRKKNIKCNNKRLQPEDIIYEGDKIQLYLSDETIEKFTEEIRINKSNLDLNIIYEDDNIVLINKQIGVLSHSDGSNDDNIVDAVINYLVDNGEYQPTEEINFTPSIVNRLDYNTSGIIIVGKNYESLKDLNESMRQYNIHRYYETIVRGVIEKEIKLRNYIIRNNNTSKIVDKFQKGAQEVITHIRPLKNNGKYSLLEVELITGRTHQIRAHLSSIDHPIIGDRKYGDSSENNYFRKKFNLEDQYLHSNKVYFSKVEGSIKYLEGKEFLAGEDKKFKKIKLSLF